MIKWTRKEKKLLDVVIGRSFDGNHVTCHHGCPCREEALRRMARTLLMVMEPHGRNSRYALEVMKSLKDGEYILEKDERG